MLLNARDGRIMSRIVRVILIYHHQKFWLIGMHFKFSGSVILLKFKINGNLSIIACFTKFIIH
jgi:hypothetical protein